MNWQYYPQLNVK